jgi:hypothetical protein
MRFSQPFGDECNYDARHDAAATMKKLGMRGGLGPDSRETLAGQRRSDQGGTNTLASLPDHTRVAL